MLRILWFSNISLLCINCVLNQDIFTMSLWWFFFKFSSKTSCNKMFFTVFLATNRECHIIKVISSKNMLCMIFFEVVYYKKKSWFKIIFFFFWNLWKWFVILSLLWICIGHSFYSMSTEYYSSWIFFLIYIPQIWNLPKQKFFDIQTKGWLIGMAVNESTQQH